MSKLPLGIWDDPNQEEQNAYSAFVDAWNMGEEEYLEHYNQWIDNQDVLTSFAYSYDSCGTCEPNPGPGEIGELIIFPQADPNLIQSSAVGSELYDFSNTPVPTDTGQCDFLAFQTQCWQAFDQESNIKQVWGGHPLTNMCASFWGFVRFDLIELPENARINYARLRIWPLYDNPDLNLTPNIIPPQLCFGQGLYIPESYDPGADGQNHIFKLATVYDSSFAVYMGTSRYNINSIFVWEKYTKFQPQYGMTAEEMKTEILTRLQDPTGWLTTDDLLVTKHTDDGDYFLIQLTGQWSNTYFQMWQNSPQYSGITFETTQTGTTEWICPIIESEEIEVTGVGIVGQFTTETWQVGIPVDSSDISCIIQNQEVATVIVEYNAPTTYYPYVADSSELLVWYEMPPAGVLLEGSADNNQEGIFDEYAEGGISDGGVAEQQYTPQPIPEGGAICRGCVAQFLFWTGTGGVIVDRPDVELHLDFETPDDSTAEDISAHERHATLINMDSTNFVDGRKDGNKVIDFEV